MKFGERSLNNLRGLHPDLVKVMMAAIENSPVDFTITDGVRTTEQQKALYAKGRTAQGKIVTNADGVNRKSNHQVKSDSFGYALDLYPYINGRINLNDTTNVLPKIAKHIITTAHRLNVKVEWGGAWRSFIDKPHFELKKS